MKSGTILTVICVAAPLALLAGSDTSIAQQLFRYRDANGVWVYTDRQPDGAQPFEESRLSRSFEPAEVRLYRRAVGDGVELIAQSTYFGPVQVGFSITRTNNVAEHTPLSGLVTLPARSEMQVALIDKQVATESMSFESEFQFLPGDPGAQHRPEQPYRLPFALATGFAVSQAFPQTITHTDPSSQHAIDFVMPVGTAIYASREGVVIEVASDYFDSGLDPSVDGPRANIVRVLHDDGTMSLYAHLSWNSIRVVPGERVRRGQYLADSGNTGFSTGPHLHFVVQRNRDGAMVSVPVEFSGADGRAIAVRTGDRVTAY